jgi:hypothetical protein
MIGDPFSQSLCDLADASRRAEKLIRALAAEMRQRKAQRPRRNHPQRRLHK